MSNTVEKGYNSDLMLDGMAYHVQTEDWGGHNPYLVSRVFCNGAVVKSVKTAYEKILPPGQLASGESIRMALRYQHEQILDLLISGQLLS